VDACKPLMAGLRDQGFNFPPPDIRRSRTNPNEMVGMGRSTRLNFELLRNKGLTSP